MKRNPRRSAAGLSEVELLVALIFLILIALIIVPRYLASRHTAAELAAVGSLRAIHEAEQKYFAMTPNGYFGDFIDLSKTGKVLPESWAVEKVTVKTYTFALTRSDSFKRYCALARSEETGEKDFGINTEGIVYEAKKGTMSCAGGDLGGGPLKVSDAK
jgi:type II secretory pathway pseudopilin PulG